MAAKKAVVQRYGRPFVSKWWHDIRALFPTYTCNHSCYTIYVRFFCHVYLRSFLLCGVFIPKYMAIFLQTRIYMRTKKVHIYALQTSMCIWVTESRRIRGTESYRQQKIPSCTIELKSNFSWNQAWPQWPSYNFEQGLVLIHCPHSWGVTKTKTLEN